MVHQVFMEAFIFDVRGRKLMACRSGSNTGNLWLCVRNWLARHPEAGAMVEKPCPVTYESILGWVKMRKELAEDLSGEDWEKFEKACKEMHAERGKHA
jgi:hypothetical protein